MPVVLDINGLPRFIPASGGVPGASALGSIPPNQISLTDFIGRSSLPPSQVVPSLRPPTLPQLTGPVAGRTQLPALRAPTLPAVTAPGLRPPGFIPSGPTINVPPLSTAPIPTATTAPQLLLEGPKPKPSFLSRIPRPKLSSLKALGPAAGLSVAEGLFGGDLEIGEGFPEPIANRLSRMVTKELTKGIPIIGPAVGLSLDLEEKIETGRATQFDKVMKGFIDSTFAAPARIGIGLAESGKDIAAGATDFFTLSDEERAAKQAEDQQVQQDAAVQAQNVVQQIAAPMFQAAFGQGSTSTITVPFDLNNVKFSEPPPLPPPPPGADYAEVFEALQKAMPEDPRDMQDFQMQSTLAVIAGMASGLLDSNAPLGQTLLKAGLGAVAARGEADASQAKLVSQYKDQLNNYWIRIANVKKLEAESDADYDTRVWENKNNNMLREYTAEKAKMELLNGRTVQGKDGQIHIITTRDNGDGTGTQQIRTYKPGETTANLAGIIKAFTPLVGKQKAEVIAMETARTGDRSKAMGIFIVASAKANGSYEKLLNTIAARVPDLKEKLLQVGQTTQLVVGGTASDQAKMIANQRDALLIDFILSNPLILLEVGKLAGVGAGLNIPGAQ